jgi:hypothetical protein
MFTKPHAVWVFLSILSLISACDYSDSGNKYPDSDMYNFSRPNVVKLPQELDEISGIVYYPKDSSIFAIIDEGGDLYKFPLKDPKKLRKWKFDKKRDFEDLLLYDSTFYVLISNGDIEKLTFKDGQFQGTVEKMEDAATGKNEFESLFGSPDSTFLIIMCKDCEEDSKKTLTTYAYHFTDSADKIQKHIVYDISTLHQKLGIEKRLHPSAAAINPITKDIYIISAIQKLLIILNSKGEFKDFYKLNPALYKQPEGMAFTPNGDLIISNEFAEDGVANLLLLKNKMNKK